MLVASRGPDYGHYSKSYWQDKRRPILRDSCLLGVPTATRSLRRGLRGALGRRPGHPTPPPAAWLRQAKPRGSSDKVAVHKSECAAPG